MKNKLFELGNYEDFLCEENFDNELIEITAELQENTVVFNTKNDEIISKQVSRYNHLKKQWILLTKISSIAAVIAICACGILGYSHYSQILTFNKDVAYLESLFELEEEAVDNIYNSYSFVEEILLEEF